MKNSQIRKLRRKAAESQGWQCFYCEQPMWDSDPKDFSTRYRVPERAALVFRCTAEHLQARSDGGRDSEKNIVAACQHCNNKRHRSKRPKDADDFLIYVRSRMKKGRWHSVRPTF
ncbi:restriction endonuclease [Rhizobium sp. MHM7A]|nr:restriction endonuclease [Rhizobium sp. MHM7A]